MSLQTEISWADATINPWVGCSRGCKYCYMYTMQRIVKKDPTKLVRSSDATFCLPTAKTRDGAWRLPAESMVFVCSFSDFFDVEVPDAWRYEFFEQIKARPDVTFMLLTKSVENMARFMRKVWAPNVWLGVSIENQAIAEHRLPYLGSVGWPQVRFVNAAPLHGALDLTAWADMLDWVIIGGQSGYAPTPPQPRWVQAVQAQCLEHNIDFWFTKWGAWHPVGRTMCRGKEPEPLAPRERARPALVY